MPDFDLTTQDRADVVSALEHFADYLADFGDRDYAPREADALSVRVERLRRRLSE